MYGLLVMLLPAAWAVVLLPVTSAPVAAVLILAACLGAVYAVTRPRGGAVLGVTAAASAVTALTGHMGVLLLAWLVSGAALTVLVRREGGETSGKPGRILELQQHAASVFLFLVVAGSVTVTTGWAMPGVGGWRMSDGRILALLSGAGLAHGVGVWHTGAAVLLTATAALRLGLFPFPFSLRRSARRLQGFPLLMLLAVFLPASMIALLRLHVALHADSGSLLAASFGLLGCVALVTGALWLQVEWLAESVLGQVAQCHLGLALLGVGFGNPTLVTLVVVQMAVALVAGGMWTIRMRSLVQTADLATAADGYARHRELGMWHMLFVVLAIPWPGTPGGQVWMAILGRSMASGTGVGVLVLVGVVLLFCGLFRSIGKVCTRLRRDPAGDSRRISPYGTMD
jgi:hypothetical protein